MSFDTKTCNISTLSSMQRSSAENEWTHCEIKSEIDEERYIFGQIKEEIITDVCDENYINYMQPSDTGDLIRTDQNQIKVEEQIVVKENFDLFNSEENKELMEVSGHIKQSKVVIKMDSTELANSDNNCFTDCATSSSIPFLEKIPDQFRPKGEQVAEGGAAPERTDERKKRGLTLNCQLCSFECETAKVLEIHMQIHVKTYQCPCCPYGANRMYDMDNHTLLHDGRACFVCTVCGYRCAQKHHMTMHMRIHSGDRSRRFFCCLCPYTSATQAAVNVHMRTHSAEKPFKCAECPFRANHKSGLKCHISTKHAGESKPKRRFACTVCSKTFSTKFYFTNHVKKHTGDLAFHCAHCPYKTSHKALLVRHMAKHSARDHCCDVCREKYESRGMLEKHIARDHNGPGPLLCRLCSLPCRAKSRLAVHEKSHSLDKPYQCPQCDKKFKYKRYLDEHRQTYRISCHLCSFKCCGLPLLVSHIRSSHVQTHQVKTETASMLPNV